MSSFTHALSTNRYGEGDLIVSTNPANGSHTTLTSAMAAAVSGQTIFLRDSVTENITITPGVNIAAWTGGSLNTPTLTGQITMTGAGTSNISGIRLVTNSAPVVTVSGSSASILNLSDCYINATNNTAFSYSSSSSSSQIFLKNCRGDLGTTGIAFVTSTAAGEFRCHRTNITNSGASTTASSTSTSLLVFRHCDMPMALSTSSTGSIDAKFCNFDTTAYNATAVTTAGTGISTFSDCDLGGGTASSVSIGSGTTVRLWNVGLNSSNTNCITGAGTLLAGNLTFIGSSSTVNTTTQTALPEWVNAKYNIDANGYPQALGLPRFAARLTTNPTNVTGDGTTYTLICDSEITDIGSNYNNSTGIYTIPAAGFYVFSASALFTSVSSTAWNTGVMQIVRKNSGGTVQRQSFYRINPGKVFDTFSQVSFTTELMDLCAAGDTIQVDVSIGGSTKTIGVFGDAATNNYTCFSGFMVSKT